MEMTLEMYRDMADFVEHEVEPIFDEFSFVSDTDLVAYYNEESRNEFREHSEEGLYGAGTGYYSSEVVEVKTVTTFLVFQVDGLDFLNYVDSEIWNKKKDEFLCPQDVY